MRAGAASAGSRTPVPPWLLHPAALPCVLAVAAFAELMAQSVVDVVTYLLAAITCTALAWRVRAPVVTALTVFGGFALHVVVEQRQLPGLGEPPRSLALTLVWLTAVYAAAARSRGTVPALGVLVAGAATAWLLTSTSGPHTAADVLAAVLFSLAVPFLAGAVHARHRRNRALLRRLTDLERAQQEAAAQERTALAREVHDIVAHSLGVIVVQAEAGEAVLERQPARAASSLRSIQQVARDALRETRCVLELLRAGQQPDARAPGAEEVERLVTQVRAAGMPVRLTTHGGMQDLPRAPSAAVYRLVQEALTNALRHSDRSGVDVTVRRSGDELSVHIRDHGDRGADAVTGRGHGLLGMRERVRLSGGTLQRGALDSGGYRIVARWQLAHD